MKKNILYLVLCVVFTSCSHRVVRNGYQIKNSDTKACDIALVRYRTFSDSTLTKIGEVKLGDGGFSSKCTEVDAIAILKKEGCSVGANIINIIDYEK
jgi:hypothetical protein